MGIFRRRSRGNDAGQWIDDQIRQALNGMTADSIVGVEFALTVGLDIERDRQTGPLDLAVNSHMGAFMFALVNGAADPMADHYAGLANYREAAADSARRFADDPTELLYRAESIISGHLQQEADPDDRIFNLFVGLMQALATPPMSSAEAGNPIDTGWMFPHIREAFLRVRNDQMAGVHGGDEEWADVGLGMIDHCRQIMAVDDEWSIDRKRGWSWWAHRLRQDIDVEPPHMEANPPYSVVRIATQVVKGVEAPDDEVGRVISDLNRRSVLTSYGWDPVGRSLCSTTALVVHPETQWMQFTVSYAVWLQIDHAEWLADQVVEQLGGAVATTPHPKSGLRPDPDGMLTGTLGAMRPTTDDIDLDALADAMSEKMADFGVCPLEDPGTNQPGFTFFAGPGKTPVEVRLLRNFRPKFSNGDFDDGPGLAVTTVDLPTGSPIEAAIRNLAEFRADPVLSLIGGWWHDGKTGGYSAFLPLIPALGVGKDDDTLAIVAVNYLAAAAGRIAIARV